MREFQALQETIRSYTLGCIDSLHAGAYIHGPPGVSKTFTVLGTLRERKAYWRLHQRITAKPLYLELEQHHSAVHVIDDCEQLFNEAAALTLLRSALGGDVVNGRRERLVSYSVTGSRARVMEHHFSGAIIFTSNRPMAEEKPEVRAVVSRIPHERFSPPDHQLRAVMRHVARQGYVSKIGSMSPLECIEVIEHVIAVASDKQRRLDLRWIDHAYGHYLTNVAGGGKVDWRDMVKCHLIDMATSFDHTPAQPSAAEGSGQAGEIAIAQEITQMPGLSEEQRLRIWTERTKRSRATYYRRLRAGHDKAMP